MLLKWSTLKTRGTNKVVITEHNFWTALNWKLEEELAMHWQNNKNPKEGRKSCDKETNLVEAEKTPEKVMRAIVQLNRHLLILISVYGSEPRNEKISSEKKICLFLKSFYINEIKCFAK